MNTFRDEDKASVSAKVIKEVDKWMERFDCLVIGPGLGRDQFLLVCIFKSVFSSFNLNACRKSISNLVKISEGQLILSLDAYPIVMCNVSIVHKHGLVPGWILMYTASKKVNWHQTFKVMIWNMLSYDVVLNGIFISKSRTNFLPAKCLSLIRFT